MGQTTETGVSKADFARELGLTRGRISQLVKSGMPTLENGRIDPEAARAWYIANVDDLRRKHAARQPELPAQPEQPSAPAEAAPTGAGASARARRDAAEAELKELELQRRRGELVEAGAVERATFARARGERDALLAWVSQAAPELAADLGADAIATFNALDRLVRAHLARMAETGMEELNDGDGS